MNTKFPSNVTREFQGVLDRDSKRVYRDGRNFRGKRIVAAVNSPFQAELFISGEGGKVGASEVGGTKYESGDVDTFPDGISWTLVRAHGYIESAFCLLSPGI